jgi:hypothetical protein
MDYDGRTMRGTWTESEYEYLIMRTSQFTDIAGREAPPIRQIREDSILLNPSLLMQEELETACSTQTMRITFHYRQ